MALPATRLSLRIASDPNAGYGGDFDKYTCLLYVSVNMLTYVCFGYSVMKYLKHMMLIQERNLKLRPFSPLDQYATVT
jgi:hypothetical protein